MYYYDLYGWHTAEVLPGRETDIAPPADIPEGMAANFTGHKWLVVKYVAPVDAPTPQTCPTCGQAIP